MHSLTRQELTDGHDPNTAVRLQPQQMFIAADNDKSARFNGAFKNLVICRIIFHNIERLRRGDVAGQAAYHCTSLGNPFGRPADLRPRQHAGDFIEIFVSAVTRSIYRLPSLLLVIVVNRTVNVPSFEAHPPRLLPSV